MASFSRSAETLPSDVLSFPAAFCLAPYACFALARARSWYSFQRYQLCGAKWQALRATLDMYVSLPLLRPSIVSFWKARSSAWPDCVSAPCERRAP